MLCVSCRNAISGFGFLGSVCCQPSLVSRVQILWGYFLSKSLFWTPCPWYALSCLALWNMFVNEEVETFSVCEVHFLSDIFKICCLLQLVSNQQWQDSSCAPFMSCLVALACTKFMHRTHMCCHSKWDETNFTHLVVNWVYVQIILAVRWNFIVEKTLRENNSTAEQPKKSVLSLSLR